jgi:hypothetical protein
MPVDSAPVGISPGREVWMPVSGDDFRRQHGGEIREALIMIEGNDGAFELFAHGWLAGGEGGVEEPFALVRSIGTDRTHLLVHRPDPRHVYSWHRMRGDALRTLQARIARLRADAVAADRAARSQWLVSASEKPRSRSTG